jgi:hypothetical protein
MGKPPGRRLGAGSVCGQARGREKRDLAQAGNCRRSGPAKPIARTGGGIGTPDDAPMARRGSVGMSRPVGYHRAALAGAGFAESE